MVIQKPTELTRIRNPPSWGIPQAPICQLLNIIYLSYGKLGMVFLIIQVVLLEIGSIEMALVFLIGSRGHPS